MSPMKVLLVDDMQSMRQIMSHLVRSCGHEATEADCGMKALRMLESIRFDLILSDWNMPGMTGTELVKAIRVKNKTTPIVMVTAESDRQRVLELREIGVNGYLVKPFQQGALVAVLNRVFAPVAVAS